VERILHCETEKAGVIYIASNSLEYGPSMRHFHLTFPHNFKVPHFISNIKLSTFTFYQQS
jgi:hypothetical protein